MNENKEYVIHAEEMGTIRISEDVLAAVAASSAVEVDGVSALMNTQAGKKGLTRGVRIAIDGEKVAVDVYLMVRYGQPIPEVAEKVQSAVSTTLEAMTGFSVGCVNIHVGGVSFE